MLIRISFLAITAVLLYSTFVSITFAHGKGRKTQGSNQQASTAKRGSQRETAKALTAEDRAAIRALDSTFVRGWLNDDASPVLSVFAPDAILFPPGSNPVRGLPAIRSYWWPQDGSRTRITAFERHIEEIEGTSRLAFLRGTASLSWTYEKDGKQTSQTSRSIDLLLLTRDAAGHWHVIRQIWSTLPN